jgi:hypothetical protein
MPKIVKMFSLYKGSKESTFWLSFAISIGTYKTWIGNWYLHVWFTKKFPFIKIASLDRFFKPLSTVIASEHGTGGWDYKHNTELHDKYDRWTPTALKTA